MDRPRLFVLVSEPVRQRAAEFVLREAPEGCEVLVTPERMSDGQRKRFHAICGEIARAGLEWAGRQRSAAEWKTLLVSGHTAATGETVEMVEGLEGELVNLRESTSRMSKRRGSSLLEYATAFAVSHGVRLRASRSDYEEQPSAQSRRGDTDRHGPAR